MFRILRNAAYCRGCHKIIESKSRHDYVECGCGNAVDGGLDYARRVGDVAKLVDLSRYVKEDGTMVDEASKALTSENGEAVDVILKWVVEKTAEERREKERERWRRRYADPEFRKREAERSRKRMAEWLEKGNNRKHYNARRREYYWENRERIKEYKQEYYQENCEKIKEHQRNLYRQKRSDRKRTKNEY